MNHSLRTLPSRGYILLLTLVFFGVFFTVAGAYLGSITTAAKSMRVGVASAQALSLAEAGIDKAIYELNQSGSYAGESDAPLGGGEYSIAVANVGTNTKRVTVTASIPTAANPTAVKSVSALVNVNTSTVSFHYGAQVGAGGVVMNNSSRIEGNVFSNGSVSGTGTITGDVTVASGTPATSVSGVTVGGTVRARSLSSCSVGGDAYYETTSSCSVAGTAYAGTPAPAPSAMPISEAQIDEWEAIAAAGTVINSSLNLSGSSAQTIGPAVINGNLTVSNTASLTLSGIVWVKGNINFSNSAQLRVSATTGNAGSILIADLPGSESSVGTVTLSNSFAASGNGSAGSFPMILSTNSGSSAISLSNNTDSVILYASRGTIQVNNGAGANQLTGYRLMLNNNSSVTYLSGLQDADFYNGPGGSWTVIPHTYSITR